MFLTFYQWYLHEVISRTISGQGNSLLGDPTAEMLAKVKDPGINTMVFYFSVHL